MKALRVVLARIDAWQRREQGAAAVAYGVLKKFGDDKLNQYVVGLGWYGFLAIYPLLLVVVTIFGFIGVSSLGQRHRVDACTSFPWWGASSTRHTALTNFTATSWGSSLA